MGNLKPKRIIDTFQTMDLEAKRPDVQNQMDSLNEYSLKKGYGLELRKRRRKRKAKIL